jgi:hypothetical protein
MMRIVKSALDDNIPRLTECYADNGNDADDLACEAQDIGWDALKAAGLQHKQDSLATSATRHAVREWLSWNDEFNLRRIALRRPSPEN